ncbi:MAG: carbohydrate kinase family protein [Methylococcaceae bacterium]|nr:MAG: carbohydrate kinase family protein [Methylococcaceae bacterium]
MRRRNCPQRFFCVGSLNTDITFPVTRLPEEHEKLRCDGTYITQGGSAANTAYWLARLDNPTTMLGCVGEDALGMQAIQSLAQVKIKTEHVQRTAQAATGVAVIFSTPAGKRMVTSNGANAYFDPALVPDNLFGPVCHWHFTRPEPHIVLPLLERAKAFGSTTSCDLDQGPDASLLPLIDVCFINHTTALRWLGTDEAFTAWRKTGGLPRLTFVITHGPLGATAANLLGPITIPAQKLTVVDRTGGGDAFTAGYLHALTMGLVPADGLRHGLYLAAQVITQESARPTVVELDPLVRGVAYAGVDPVVAGER